MNDGPYRFGQFELYTNRRELLCNGTPLQINRQAFDILCQLAAARGEVVTKEELLSRVWPNVTVADGSVHVHVSALRKALEGSNGSTHIVTVPSRGYRLFGIAEEPPASNPSASAPAGASIAVLPFSNLSGDPEQDYLVDGLVEEIITGLSRIKGLFVIARNSSFTYKGRAVNVREVGLELGVRYVLEGSLRKSGQRIRVTAQLIDTGDAMHLWAENVEVDHADILEIQDRITDDVVNRLLPQLDAAEIRRIHRHATEDPEAYDCYLRGLQQFHLRTRPSIDQALEMFDRSIALDSSFARPYGLAAACHLVRKVSGWSTGEPARIEQLARHVALIGNEDAIALSFASLALAHSGDTETGLAMVNRALSLSSNLAIARMASGFVHLFRGEIQESIADLSLARQLSPIDPYQFGMNAAEAAAHFFAGDYDVARELAREAVRLQPNAIAAIRIFAASSASLGDLDEARRAVADMQRIDPGISLLSLRDRLPPYSEAQFGKLSEALKQGGLR
jgi:TolB-like protein